MQIEVKNPAYIVDLRRPEPVHRAEEAQTQAPAASSPAKVTTLDRVVISPRAREVERLKQAVSEIPEVRLDKVALAKQQMQYGSYRVDPALVAQSLVDSFRRG